jgi:hypothetical protein
MDVIAVALIILTILDALIGETAFPDFEAVVQFLPRTIGETSLDKLNGFLQRNFVSRRHQQMEMIVHHHEFMKLKARFAPVFFEDIEEQMRHSLGLKGTPSLMCH